MAFYHILILALIQGITEFLPISSSGHLVLAGPVLGWNDQGLAIDVAVHVGTLFAVMLYFWRDMWRMLAGIGRLLIGRPNADTRLVLHLILATLPIVIVGFLFYDEIANGLRSIELIAWTTIGFGLLLWVGDKVGLTVWRIEHVGIKSALIIGLCQVLALIPGTSRSGITMTAARFLGMERPDAARFSMLMSIPTIIAAGSLTALEIHQAGDLMLERTAMMAAGLAFVAGLIAIACMMAWLKRASFTPFVLYRLILGGALLAWIYL